jgi:Fe-S cluster biogenesis protein NfuA
MFGMMAGEMHNEPELSTPEVSTPELANRLPGEERLTDEEKSARLAQLTDIIEMVRPIIQQDGGDLILLSADVESGVIELQLQGACSSCAISATTLQAGVERILKDRLDWVTEISGGVDEEMDWQESASMGRGAYVPKW